MTEQYEGTPDISSGRTHVSKLWGYDRDTNTYRRVCVDGEGRIVIQSVGDTDDSAETDPAQTATLIALIKGMVTLINTVNTNLVTINGNLVDIETKLGNTLNVSIV
jgi:hypothetical protein